jgi:DNA-binding PadR family transcriptional regulator
MADGTPVPGRVKGEGRALTTTSYAILGLLSIRPWSAYELTRQMQRSVRFHWPRADTRVYMEAPNLVAHGLATSSEAHTGARRRTVYAITRRGRVALGRWLAESSAPPQLESEAQLRVLYADSGTKEDLVRTLRQLHDQAHESWTQLMGQGVEYLETGGPFPRRLHLIALNGRFLLAYTQLLMEWTRWAEHEVTRWPDTRFLDAEPDPIVQFRDVLGADIVEHLRAWGEQRDLHEESEHPGRG